MGLVLGLLLMGSSLAFAEAPSQGPAQDIVRLVQSGVDSSVIDSYMNTVAVPIGSTADDLAQLKKNGVPSDVLAAIARHDRALRSVGAPTEASMFRLWNGFLYHKGRVYEVGDGLPLSVHQELWKDSFVRPYLGWYQSQRGTAATLTWSAVALIVGGSLTAGFATIDSAARPAGLAGVGVGALCAIVGFVFNGASYQTLYNGLYQYNNDLISNGTGGQ